MNGASEVDAYKGNVVAFDKIFLMVESKLKTRIVGERGVGSGCLQRECGSFRQYLPGGGVKTSNANCG